MNFHNFKDYLLLTLQSALLCNVTNRILAVLVSWHEKNIYVRVIFDGQVSDEDFENVSVIETEIIADLPSNYFVKCVADSCSNSKSINIKEKEILVFKRFIEK